MSVIKTAVEASPIIIADYHKAVFAVCNAHRKAGETMAKKMEALLKSKYGEHMPNLKQYSDDQAALAELAKQKGLKDNQWVRKPYATSVVALYGGLPVSMDGAAVTKRAQRMADLPDSALKAHAAELKRSKELGLSDMEAESRAQYAIRSAKAASTPKAGAKAGEAREQKPNQSESLEQWISRVGIVAVLDACQKILASDKTTKTQASTLAAIAAQCAGKLQPAKAA